MADASTLSQELLFVAGLMGMVANGKTKLAPGQAGSIADTLGQIAERCAAIDEERVSLEQQLAVMRRWFCARDFDDDFARLKAIQAGVRDGRVIDLVTVFERERALAATMHGGAA